MHWVQWHIETQRKGAGRFPAPTKALKALLILPDLQFFLCLFPLILVTTIQTNGRRDGTHLDYISRLYYAIYIYEIWYREITFSKIFLKNGFIL